MDWIKRNKDAIVVATVSIATTAVVVLVTHKIVTDHVRVVTSQGSMQMSLIAESAGVLDQIIAHQEKLSSLGK